MKRCILLDIRGYCLYKLKTHDLVNIKRRFLRELEVWPWNHQENQTLNTIEEGKKEERNDLVTPPSQRPVPDSSPSTSSISSPPPKKVSSLWKICESWIVTYITGAPFKYDDRMDETWTKAMIEEIRLVEKSKHGSLLKSKRKGAYWTEIAIQDNIQQRCRIQNTRRNSWWKDTHSNPELILIQNWLYPTYQINWTLLRYKSGSPKFLKVEGAVNFFVLKLSFIADIWVVSTNTQEGAHMKPVHEFFTTSVSNEVS